MAMPRLVSMPGPKSRRVSLLDSHSVPCYYQQVKTTLPFGATSARESRQGREDMNEISWYYYEAGTQKGPVSEHTLGELLDRQIIPTNTLVWRNGMSDWQPASQVFPAQVRSNAPQMPVSPPLFSEAPQAHSIKKMPVILTIIFTIITAGIYYPCWFLTRRSAINSLRSSEKLGIGVFVFGIVVFVISLVLELVIGGLQGAGEQLNDTQLVMISERLYGADRLISIVVGITLLVQCFKVRRILRDHFNESLGQTVQFSGVALFFFQIYYLQYKVNRL
jgi:predicted secreted protein